ncbi:MAG: hypothetical protein P0S96_08000 [Simkaniaceae bacterium]|nr:hypothetical protein [Candidatus Sacchlamyda saccharinae]
MEKFFNDLLFKEGGVYTLLGSKPVTEVVLYHYTDEEMAELQKHLTPEELENCYVDDQYDLPKNWERWEKYSSDKPLKRHLLFRSHYSEDGKSSYVYFVDIVKTALLLQDNYDLFAREVGFVFNPLEVVLEMPSKTSAFWEKVRESRNATLLWGLLFGYGKENASLFSWKYLSKSEKTSNFVKHLPCTYSNPPPVGKVELTIENLLLPSFVSFTLEDKVLDKYIKERKEIQLIYKQNDLLTYTLQQLGVDDHEHK